MHKTALLYKKMSEVKTARTIDKSENRPAKQGGLFNYRKGI